MSSVVLLDSGIVGRLFQKDESLNSQWLDFMSMVLTEKIKMPRIAIPTPICYEFSQSHSDWYKFIQKQIQAINKGKATGVIKMLFQYANHSITSQILYAASWYILETRSGNSNKDIERSVKNNKINYIDALLASYSLLFGHYLFTLNQSDFPDKFFEIVDMRLTPNTTALNRSFSYLLKPKSKEWKNCLPNS